MSERTTIGGTVYEAIGSSSSNLLLKCNGTARIQWGNKIIDLIKNGKIVSEDSLELIFIILDESEIKSNGVYILTNQESNKLIINKDGNRYDFTNSDLYISASNPLILTADLKKQALDNIGLNYNSLEELQNSKIQNGIAYVLNNKTLYTIKDGIIAEFEAKLKTVAVDNTSVEGNAISGKVKLVLSVLDDEYIVLEDQRIIVNHSIHVKDSAQLGSEGADDTRGYRFRIDGGVSYLDVDSINVRNGININQYKKVTFKELIKLILESKLLPLFWYLITDYLNHWKLIGNNENRPILIKALSENSLLEEGFLLYNPNIKIKYDYSYQDTINYNNGLSETAKGKITWMKDQFNNEANFDFLDYTDFNKNPLTILHEGSIFPKGSYNNKLFVYNLKGITVVNNTLDDTNVNQISFSESIKNMHDNFMEVKTLIVNTVNFHNNTLVNVNNLNVSADCYNNNLDNVDNIQITHNIELCTLTSLINSTINAILRNCKFKKILECVFEEGIIENVTSYCDLIYTNFNRESYNLLYNALKIKEIYNNSEKIKVVCIPDMIFHRGMIVMHSGIEPIPEGWAICDGKEYEWNGIKTTTPNLIDKFIKAATTAGNTGGSNKLTLTLENLPNHTHTLDGIQTSENGSNTHNHTILEKTVSTDSALIEDTTFTWKTVPDATTVAEMSDITTVKGTNLKSLNEGDYYLDSVSNSQEHTHSVVISNSSTENYFESNHKHTLNNLSTSNADGANNTSIDIEPEYYSLIFIIKL